MDLPEAVIRRAPEDFVVEEIPAYAASGRGEHLFVTFTKRDLTTVDAANALARALDVDARSAGFAGMKDRHAVTTQTVSFGFPMARDADAVAGKISIPGITVTAIARHDNKLKPGHLIGNRFVIRLSDVAPEAAASIVERLELIGREGVPNAFGPQRFGRDGENPERAFAWLGGRERGPRNPREQRFLFSAVQSLLFNRVLSMREADATWSTVLPGDVAKKHDSGGLFDVPLEGPELEDARARAAANAISATGPMFGTKMRWPTAEPGRLEREVLEATELASKLEGFRHLGEGTRRALRLFVASLRVTRVEASASPDGAPEGGPDATTGRAVLVVEFVLPKGGYATTVLGRACRLIDGAPRRGPPQTPPDFLGVSPPEEHATTEAPDEP